MSVSRPRGAPLAPKPYTYVPVADEPRRGPLQADEGHDRFAPGRLAGRLTGRATALTPVHVGAGGVERTARVAPALAAETPLLFPLVRSAGVPILPGPTLRGAVRSVVEAVTAACLAVRGEATRLLPPPLQPLRPCTRRDALCPACRLFGTLGYQGRVRFADARLAEGDTAVAHAPPLFQPRPGRGGAPPGRKFYRHGNPAQGTVPLEVCPAGAVFGWRLELANLQPAELGLLLLALGLGEPPLWLKIGGYKPACFGSLRFELDALSLDDPSQRYLTYDGEAESAEPSADTAPYLSALADSDLLLADRVERLATILQYPGEGDCPGGGY